MKAIALIVAATGLTVTAAKADVWFYPAPVYVSHRAPYVVTFPGDVAPAGRPYWGGPFWTDCRGIDPPYDSYQPVMRSCRRWAR